MTPGALSHAAIPSAATAGSGVEGPLSKNFTTAYGYVYDDPSGKPLDTIPVHLAAWIGCTRTSRSTSACPADLRYHTFSNANGRFELEHVPNGHYLLVVGSDDDLDFVRATVHDQVWFTGGLLRLAAPSLPSQPRPRAPFPSPMPVRIPAVERSGNYRLATLDVRLEFPCLSAFNHARAGRGLPAFIVDEWMLENVRAIVSYDRTVVPGGRTYVTEPIFTGTSEKGGKNCRTSLVDPAFDPGAARALALDPRSLWYAGEFLPRSAPGQAGSAHGWQLFGIDPRAYRDPSNPPWP
jgi:hypothetical protein